MKDRDKILVSITIDAGKNCIHVFEAESPADDRPEKALEATEMAGGNDTRESPVGDRGGESDLEIKGL